MPLRLGVVVQNSIHQNIYGKSLAITSVEAQLSTTIIENPEMLKYQPDRQGAERAGAVPNAGHENQTPKLTNVVNGESLEDIRKVRHDATETLVCQLVC